MLKKASQILPSGILFYEAASSPTLRSEVNTFSRSY